ncbi:MAG: hypothetical protein JW888_01670 [Pirellulales bacterium]|nr:hypothetical protein [Pirellulales bacterium]
MITRCNQRTWLPVAGIMLLGVILTGCDAARKKEDAAGAMIQISMRPPSLLGTGQHEDSIEEYKIFRATQAQLIKSPMVLMAALRKPEIAELSIYQREEADPVAWLQDSLEVSFPVDSEIMRVTLADGNTEEAAKMVQAVVDAYLDDVVENERKEKHRTLAELDRLLADKEQDIRHRRSTLKRLGDELGTTDPETLRVQTQYALQQLNLYQQELLAAKRDLRKHKAERAVMQAALARMAPGDVVTEKSDAATAPRSQLERAAGEISALTGRLRQTVAKLTTAEVTQGMQNDLAEIERQVNAWHEMLKADGLELRRAAMKEQIADMDIRIASTTDEVASLVKIVGKQQEEFTRFGHSSVDVDMMRAELKRVEEICKNIATKRQMLQIEMQSAPRIRLLQRAEPVRSNADTLITSGCPE